MAKKYASLGSLQNLVGKIKELFATKTDLTTELAKKAESSHTHSISDTTNLQSTLDGKVPTTRTINNKPLSVNITLSASDVNADSKGSAATVQTNLDTVSDILDDHTSNSDIHFTAAERTKLSDIQSGAQVNTITGVKGNSEFTYRTGNVNITKANIGLGNVDNTADANKSVKHSTTADSATSATKATQDASGNVITSTYETKTGTDNKISTHNTSTSAHNDIRLLITELTTKLNNFLDVDDTTTDQLSELIALIQDNATDIEAITSGKVNVSDIINNLTTNVSNKPLSAAQGVAIKTLIDSLQGELDGLQEELDTHTHEIADVDGLTTTLANKAEKNHGTHVVYLVADPLMDGEAAAGSKNEVARADHRHPTDTSRASRLHIHPYGVCTTSGGWSTKTVSVDNFSLVEGVRVVVKFENANTASSPQLNVNGTGAKPIVRYGTTKVGTTVSNGAWADGAIVAFTYDGTSWVQDFWNDTTYSNEALGQGLGYCSTQTSTTEKAVSLYKYKRVTGGIVTVEFIYSVPASATMNINSEGASEIYYRGEAIIGDVIKGGDRATFIYDGSRYHLISIDRWHEDIVKLQAAEGKVRQVLTSANANYRLLLTPDFQTETTTAQTYFNSNLYANPYSNTIYANISGKAASLNNLDATVDELNLMSGATSNVQHQIDTKASVMPMTTAEYEALEEPNANTLYMLTDDEEPEYALKTELDQKSQVQMVADDISEVLQTLKIQKLTQEEYEQKIVDGTVENNTLYLTPDEDIDLSPYATEEYVDNAIATIPTPDVSGQIENHNTNIDAHGDIRTSIYDLSTLVGDTKVSLQISTAVEQKSQVQIINWEDDD